MKARKGDAENQYIKVGPNRVIKRDQDKLAKPWEEEKER